jgi:hypothetical protein
VYAVGRRVVNTSCGIDVMVVLLFERTGPILSRAMAEITLERLT